LSLVKRRNDRRLLMNALMKPALVLGVAGALALGAMSPSEARVRPWVGAAAGFAAGAAIAGIAANSYYGPGYYDGYGYDAYAYDPGYAVGPAYVEPGYSYGYYGRSYNDYPAQTRPRRLGGHDY
jgi:hypothetical protein